MNFQKFKTAVQKRFAEMVKQGEIFRVEVDKNVLWETYLKSFPEGTDPIYRERTEHDCNCCKNFIRNIGDAVAIKNGEVMSIWDVTLDDQYQVVADALSALVKSKKVTTIYRHFEPKVGTDKSFEQLTNGVKNWDHFFITLPRQLVINKHNIPSVVGDFNTKAQVFDRALREIDMETIDIVLDLIKQNSIYRGEENKFAVEKFKKYKREYENAKNKDIFAIANVGSEVGSVTGIRNSAIGTLLTDIASGMDVDAAVRSFESKVAPTNYKRPTAVVTKKMIEQARDTINQLGLTSALERRYANLTDITVNNILFANRKTKNVLTGDVFDDLMGETSAKAVKKSSKVEEIRIEKFISDVLPNIDSMELMVENSHVGNLVSLIAPVDPTAQNLFKWNNNFSWTYNGDVADSIKERVKKAGGSVTGDVCCRLAWHNYDDLDFHMFEPGGYEIYFGNRNTTSPCGGRLDVDMNAGRGQSREPVENIFYASKNTMKKGMYKLVVHNFCKRETTGVGFEVELDIMGETYSFVREKAVKDGERIVVAEIVYDGKNFAVKGNLSSTTRSKKVWDIDTLTYVPVDVMMMSPNYWDEQGVGNKHYFFMLNGCINDGEPRGFLNEYLKTDLDKHRKVLEMVGSKMKAESSVDQLSGVGFSSTLQNSVMVRVKGSYTRELKIVF